MVEHEQRTHHSSQFPCAISHSALSCSSDTVPVVDCCNTITVVEENMLMHCLSGICTRQICHLPFCSNQPSSQIRHLLRSLTLTIAAGFNNPLITTLLRCTEDCVLGTSSHDIANSVTGGNRQNLCDIGIMQDMSNQN